MPNCLFLLSVPNCPILTLGAKLSSAKLPGAKLSYNLSQVCSALKTLNTKALTHSQYHQLSSSGQLITCLAHITVNSLSAKQCKGRHPLFHDLTYLVLINAIYFKADWKHPFDKTKTKKKTFYRANGRTHALMMYLKRKLDYAEIPSLNSTMIRLPYKGDRIVMDVLLPNAERMRFHFHNLQRLIENLIPCLFSCCICQTIFNGLP